MTVYSNKKNNKWYCKFTIKGVTKHLLCAGATTEKEAKEIENAFKFRLQQQLNGVIPRDDKKKKLTELYKFYEEYALLNKKSFKDDIYRLNKIKAIWKNKKYIDDIKIKDIEDLKVNLLGYKLSKTTINRYLEIISKMFNLAIANEWITKNPIKKGVKFITKNYQIRYLTEDEEKRLFKNSSGVFKDIILVALNTGLRAGNLRQLQGKNIKLDFKIIEVTENKGNKHIKLPMNETLYNFFKTKTFKDEEYIFLNPNTNQPYTESSFLAEWHKIRKKAKVEDLRFHDLRHTVGTRLAKAGVPINVIKEIMAHSDIQTTMRYVHYANEQMQNAMELL
ncbi:site-specific integrase [bacterium]|nr:site-specific integrase [bacterium]